MTQEENTVVAIHPPNFIGDDGNVYLVRCPKCRRENYSLAVSSGQCAWCGLKILPNNKKDIQ